MNFPRVAKKKTAREQTSLVYIIEHSGCFLMMQRPKKGEIQLHC